MKRGIIKRVTGTLLTIIFLAILISSAYAMGSAVDRCVSDLIKTHPFLGEQEAYDSCAARFGDDDEASSQAQSSRGSYSSHYEFTNEDSINNMIFYVENMVSGDEKYAVIDELYRISQMDLVSLKKERYISGRGESAESVRTFQILTAIPSAKADVVIVELIPKEFASSVSELIFSVPPTSIMLDDPIVKWTFSDVEANKEVKVSYSVAGEKDVETRTAAGAVEKAEIGSEDNIITGSTTKYILQKGGEGSSKTTVAILVLGSLAGVILALYLFKRK